MPSTSRRSQGRPLLITPEAFKAKIRLAGVSQATLAKRLHVSRRCIENYCAPRDNVNHRRVPFEVIEEVDRLIEERGR